MSTFRNVFAAVALFYLFFATPGFASDFDNQIIFGAASPVIVDGTSDNVVNWGLYDISESNGSGRCHVIVDDEDHYIYVCQ